MVDQVDPVAFVRGPGHNGACNADDNQTGNASEKHSVITYGADGSYREENTLTGVGFTISKYGVTRHWGPSEDDNFESHNEFGVEVKVYAQDGRKEYTYPNGDKKYESADRKSGYTVHLTGLNSPFPEREEKHWGITAAETYTLQHYSNRIVKIFADKHTETDYQGTQYVVRRGNETVSTGDLPEYNYCRIEEPKTNIVTLKFGDGREFVQTVNGSYSVEDGMRIAIGAIPDVRGS